MNILKLSTLLVIFTAFTFIPAPTVLEHKYKAGDAYEWTQLTTQTMKQSIPGMGENNTETKSESLMLLKIIEVKNNVAKTEVSFPRIKSDTKSTYGNVVLDSDGDQNVPLNKVLKAIATATMTAYITKTGNVEKIEGTEKISSAVDALGLDPNIQPAAKQLVSQYLGEGFLKVSLEQALLQYPGNKINVGDTWTTSSIAPMIPIKTDNVWKLTGIEGQLAAIENDGTMMTTDSTKEFTVQGYRAKANMKGRVAARAKADVGTGYPTEIKAISEVKGSITILAGSGIPQDMEIPTEIVTEVQHTVARKQ